MENASRERALRAIRERTFPECGVGAAHLVGGRFVVAAGCLTYELGAPLAAAETVYDFASMTKSIPVASLALMFVQEGKFRLSDKVLTHLPELQNDHGATVEDLLRYRVHGVQLSKLNSKTFEEIRAHALETGFEGPPGASVYTNLPAFFLGMILERVGAASIAELGHRYFFEPLGMDSTTFFPSASDCAPTELDERGLPAQTGEVRGLPHDESAYKFAIARRCAGHAGLFSTAPDLLKFLETSLQGNVGFTKSLIKSASQGLGWQTEGAFLGKYAGKGSFGKTGFTGTSVCVDAGKGIAFVILSNRTYPKRPADNAAIDAFRCDIADIILGR